MTDEQEVPEEKKRKPRTPATWNIARVEMEEGLMKLEVDSERYPGMREAEVAAAAQAQEDGDSWVAVRLGKRFQTQQAVTPCDAWAE